MKEQVFEPIFVRAQHAGKLGGWGLTKTFDLINKGILKTVKIDGMTLIRVADIRALGEPSKPAISQKSGPLS